MTVQPYLDDTASPDAAVAGDSRTVAGLLRDRASAAPEAAVLAAPGRPDMTGAQLLDLSASLLGALRRHGLQWGDRVAIVMPDSPELAATFLAVASGMVAAPLNPRYRQAEFEFYLSDLKAKAVLLGEGVDAPARAAAVQLGLLTFEVTPDPDGPAGSLLVNGVRLMGEPAGAPPLAAADLALLMHTSGTTSLPKLVPLTHANLVAIARNNAEAFGLEATDRCLCPMPLFHMHGLAALLATVWSGGCIACTGFLAPSFFSWVRELRPTWYTAVPAMHQAVLARAPGHPDVVAARPFRFVRSASSALAPQMRDDLEQLWGVPVIDSYGMIEASSTTSTRPHPFASRPRGSVGQPTGTEIAIADESGHLLPAGRRGEILIRGGNVMRGYEDNPAANAEAFRDGWLRTGDEGYVDEKGFLYVSGRIKEIINRGGEKISPREVDEAILAHPAVAEAVTFAVPDRRLGEAVAAAVVLREGMTATEFSVREVVAAQLADFKVPGHVVFVPELPRNATGKVQRVGLAEHFGITHLDLPDTAEPTAYVAPQTPTEDTLATIWASVLGLEQVGVDDDFIELGGDSILAARVMARIRSTLNCEMNAVDFLEHSTVAQQAALIDAQAQV